MKQKIKIMKHKQQPSDEEIQSYMNFDRLLDSRKVALSTRLRVSVLKWSIPIVVVTSLAWWFLLEKDNLPSETQVVKSQPAQQTPPLITVDSSKDEARPEQARGKNEAKKSGDTKIAKVDSESPVIKEGSKQLEGESEYVQAEPAKGYSDLYNFFNANLKYPAEGINDSIQGVQTISFIINTEGKPEQVKIVNSLGEPFDLESRRLIENMPAWKPATLNGKPVESKISIPITFQIKKIKN
jgi:TonB family protein